VDRLRSEAFGKSSSAQRNLLGQFPTPAPIARFMASLFQADNNSIRLLDAGAGVGSLTAAVVANLSARLAKPEQIHTTAFEIDERLVGYLSQTLELCRQSCIDAGIKFSGQISSDDFIQAAAGMTDGGLFGTPIPRFNCAILNPPYKKIHSDSVHRRLLRRVGIETGNLYTAFLALAVMLLEPGGELVAITPRSFCNGPYFKQFRQFFLREMSVRRVHIFESRSQAFAADEILQENIIFHAVKTAEPAKTVIISSSRGPDWESTTRKITHNKLVKPDDPEQFIHIVPDETGGHVSDSMTALVHSLDDLNLSVSTGRLVDFRSRSFLRADPEPGTAPMIYPMHFRESWIAWPKLGHKKPNACLINGESEKWLIPSAIHVLVKRFSAKEEKRRIVAAIFDPSRIPSKVVAFENHLNYFHENGKGLSEKLAKGLTAFLNSTLVDTYFRQFNGHTQVNATDLRNLKYPSRPELEKLGEKIGEKFPDQDGLDRFIEEELKEWRTPLEHRIART
jgi:adenine-specific DNA-methyltransferase